MRRSNRVGQKIGLLTIGEKVKVENGKHYYKAKCFCGNEYFLFLFYQKKGSTKL